METAPARLDALIRGRAEELLRQTANARNAVMKYLELLDRRLPINEMIITLSEGATEEELKEARRLSRTEGFICLPERACYDLISLLIARRAADIEGNRATFLSPRGWASTCGVPTDSGRKRRFPASCSKSLPALRGLRTDPGRRRLARPVAALPWCESTPRPRNGAASTTHQPAGMLATPLTVLPAMSVESNINVPAVGTGLVIVTS